MPSAEIQDTTTVADAFFVYRLIPPRPSFNQDMSEDERDLMTQHGEYWRRLTGEGRVVVFGPVFGAAGPWGLAVVEADSPEAVVGLGRTDPAVRSGLCTFEVEPMPLATTRVAAAT